MSIVSKWSVEDVSSWLVSLSLHHLVQNFERLQVDGTKLVTLTDQDLRGPLRLTKPAEVMAIRGAINKLIEDGKRPFDPSRRVSAGPRMGVSVNPRDRSGSTEKKASRTIPRDHHRNTIATEPSSSFRQPKLMQGSASELVDRECKYSGWIRKQGGGYKNWKRRYLILRLGCLYYFPNETASTAKGSFVLSGYKTEVCKESEITKKYKYTLKLIPMNPQVRTYYISVGSERELTGWKEAIDDEIRQVSRRISLEQRQSSDMSQLPSSPNAYATYDDDDDDEEDPYDVPETIEGEDDEDHNYDDPSTLFEKPGDQEGNDEDDEDDPYTKIDDGTFPLGRVGKPSVPSRSALSLQSPISNMSAALQAIKEASADDSPYLPIIAGGPARDLQAAQPDLSRTSSPPVNSSNTIQPPGHDDHDYVEDNGEDGIGVGGDDDDDEEEDDDGGYYIMFRKPEELMPPSCLFDKLERQEADRLLKDKDRDGTYLIRGGSHAGAEKVLSVWHIDRCRHYKLFKDNNSSFSLTHGQSFRTIPELLQYYTLQSHLPKSDFYLGDPFNPDDH